MNSLTPPLACLATALSLGLCAAPLLHAVDTQKAAAPHVADWAADAVWYQIFPERFRNGDPSNDPTRESLERPLVPSTKWQISSWTADWYERAPWEKELGHNFYTDGVLERRYGGDLQGVLDKLDYLADLGINALYFNPIFYARSLHKYDGNCFHHIDPNFGPDPKGDLAIMAREDGKDPKTWEWTAADKLFLRLLTEAHRRGMHVILDGVFNHSGRDCFAFKDLKKNQEQSAYRNWYVVDSFDDPRTKRDEFDYKGWWGFKSLPVFAATPDGKDMAPDPKAYIFASTRRWMDPNGNGDVASGIDGWRLDAAPERPVKFWADWNAYVRSLNPNAYTSCEIWSDASKFMAEGGFDGCMNYYAFAIPVKGFLIDARIGAKQFAQALDQRRDALPKGTALTVQNLMDSHDTDRLASMIVNAGRDNYSNPDGIQYNNNANAHLSAGYKIRKPNDRERAIQRLVVLFQMTYPGAPMIYYGDEAGMWGGTDPDDRMPMVWQDLLFAPQAINPRGPIRTPDTIVFDNPLFGFYKSAIALHRGNEALRRGDFRVLAAADDAPVFAFQRTGGQSSLVVVLNRGEKERTVHIAYPGVDAAKLPKAKSVFASNGEASSIAVHPDADGFSVTLPALTGAVIAP